MNVQDESSGPVPAPPSGLRLHSAEQLIGCSLSELDSAALDRIAASQVPESQSVEFKSCLYQRGGKGADELAKDVAAMANTPSGGLIVLGIRDEQDRAVEVTPVPVSPAETQRMRQVLLTRVAPPVAGLWIAELSYRSGSTADSGRGAYALGVPGSDAAPHAVARNDAYAWPIRDGRDTRWMHEAEIAARYRDRFALARRQTDYVSTIAQGGIGAIDRHFKCWLTLAATPSRQGFLSLTNEALQDARNWTNQPTDLPESVAWGQPTIGRRRIVITERSSETVTPSLRLELHAEGSTFAAACLTPVLRIKATNQAVGPMQPIDPADLEIWALTMLGTAANHALRVGAGGDLAVTISIESATGDPLQPAGAMALMLDPAGPHQREVSGVTLSNTTPVETTVPIEVANDLAELVSATSSITGQLLNEFGLASPWMLETDGTVRSSNIYRSHHANRLLAWAHDHGLTE